MRFGIFAVESHAPYIVYPQNKSKSVNSEFDEVNELAL